jgi:hypothetical protein
MISGMDNPNQEPSIPVEEPESPRREEAESQRQAAAPPHPEAEALPRREEPESPRREAAASPQPPFDFILRLRSRAFEILLAALILVGVYFRFAGNNWSEGTFLNPDELGVNNVVSALRMPSSIADYFNTRISPLSPLAYYDTEGNRIGEGPDPGMVWGQWPDILIRATAEGLTEMQKAVLPAVNKVKAGLCGDSESASCEPVMLVDYTGYGRIMLLGRFLSALTDTITLLALLAIGLRLYNRRIALLGTPRYRCTAPSVRRKRAGSGGTLFSVVSTE